MSRKHDAVFDDVLSGLDQSAPQKFERAGARFLNRSTRVAERLAGDLEEKTLRWVDPVQCRMWARHNRAYDLLTEENCRDLIEGIRSQGRQEFPAIVRQTDDPHMPYEVICGARRHFAVAWLRANNYPQFRYLIDLRELSDEEAFRLSDIENRDREDVSDYERACDYADAVTRYYGGRQKAMAARLVVSETWLSRYLQLARLPEEIVSAFPSIRDIRELHARVLKPHLGRPEERKALLAEARQMRDDGTVRSAVEVMARFKSVTRPPAPATVEPKLFRADPGARPIRCSRKGRKVVLEFDEAASKEEVQSALAIFLRDHFGTQTP